MVALKVLFIGGNGIISAASSRLAVARGIDLTLLNRGQSSTRPKIEGVRSIMGDADDPASIAKAIGTHDYDVVANFRSFSPAQVRADIEIFAGRTAQYVYISSASAYQKPVARLPITESTPLRNPHWQYSRDKIASEDVLVAAYRDSGFPATIVRPSHTYDATLIPLEGGWTVIDRMRRGQPIVVHGDGTSLWTLTHSTDFAKAFVGLLGNPRTIGDTFHITSDEALPWDAIAQMLARAAGVYADIVHVASDAVAREIPQWGPGLLGDKAHSVIFDNTKVRSVVPDYVATVPFWQGAKEIVDWHDADAGRRTIDEHLNAALDKLIATYSR